jgi:hypothetical protein
MGRPLYTSLLLARHATETAAQPEPPMPTYPVVEKWSRWNAFDPDSDEFFEADNAVYEAFLSDEEIAERAQAPAQHHDSTPLLLSRESDIVPSRSPILEDSDRPVVGVEAADASNTLAVQMEAGSDMLFGPRSPDEGRETQEDSSPERQPPRRQPRRAPTITEWRLSSTGGINPSTPHTSVVPAGSRLAQPASPSDPSNLVSGLQQLSESPRPMIPIDSSPRPISPIPNTPARVSGVFGTPPSSGHTVTTPSPAPTVTPRVINWGTQPMQFTTHWVSESPSPQGTPHFLDSVMPSPAPLTF